MGNCQSSKSIKKPYCTLCKQYINDKQQYHCTTCNNNYHIKCFTRKVDDLHTCPCCNSEITKIIKNTSIMKS